MRKPLTLIALALLGTAFGAQAWQHHDGNYRYRWVDGTGLPHYTDALTVKALQFGYDILDANGTVVRHVRGELTPTQREAATTTATQHRSAAEQAEHDRQLLMAYPTTASYKAVQQARIDKVSQRIHTTRINLDSQEQNLAQLLGHAAEFSNAGNNVPHALAQRIATQRKAVTDQRKLLQRQQAQRDAVSKEVAVNLHHYQQLRARQQARYGDK